MGRRPRLSAKFGGDESCLIARSFRIAVAAAACVSSDSCASVSRGSRRSSRAFTAILVVSQIGERVLQAGDACRVDSRFVYGVGAPRTRTGAGRVCRRKLAVGGVFAAGVALPAWSRLARGDGNFSAGGFVCGGLHVELRGDRRVGRVCGSVISSGYRRLGFAAKDFRSGKFAMALASCAALLTPVDPASRRIQRDRGGDCGERVADFGFGFNARANFGGCFAGVGGHCVAGACAGGFGVCAMMQERKSQFKAKVGFVRGCEDSNIAHVERGTWRTCRDDELRSDRARVSNAGIFVVWRGAAGLPRDVSRREFWIVAERCCAGMATGGFSVSFCGGIATLSVDFVDLSAGMIEMAKRRSSAIGSQASDANVGFTQRIFSDSILPAAARYDLISAQFFLDCFNDEEMARVARKLGTFARPGARLLLSDFRIPPRGVGRYIDAAIVRGLYGAFRLTTGLRVTRLPDYEGAIERVGFRKQQETLKLWRAFDGVAVAENLAARKTPQPSTYSAAIR